MDFCIVTKNGNAESGEADQVDVIFTTHHKGEPDDDLSPLQLVSAARMAYLLAIEAQHMALLESMAETVEAAPPPE